MTKFSKSTLQKLKLHLEKLKNSTANYKQEDTELKDKKFHQSRVLIKNRNVAKGLLVESVFLNLELANFNKSSFLRRFILKNRQLFVNKDLNSNSYLYIKLPSKTNTKLLSLEDSINSIIKNLKLKTLTQIDNAEKLIISTNIKFNKYYDFSKACLKDWYIYVNRFFILTIIHFVPFIQLSNTLAYPYLNPFLVNSITSSLFNISPFLMRLISILGPIVNEEDFSFLFIGLYFKLFIFSYKKYKIPRKIAFQGTFALSTMLLNYALVMSSNFIMIFYKFPKRLLFFTKYQNLDLLRDDISCYVYKLKHLRRSRQRFLQLSESIFSLDDLNKTLRIYESTTIISLLGVIALLYNYVYFILRGEKPIIPVVTKTVRRMMVDRNSDEL